MTSLFPKEYYITNMTNQEVTANDIRHWIANETNNKIVLNPSWKSEFSFNTMVKSTISINAAYFKGVWLNQFLETETKKERFYKCNEEFYEVDMMTTSGFFTLWLDQDSPVKILEIPFKGRTISMIIVMPNQKHHEEVLHEFLYTFNNEDFEDVLRVLSKKIPTTVLVRLPKMVVEKEYNLEQVLNHLGGDLLFGAVTNFQDLFVKNRCITVLKTVLHNAKVEVDEEGSVKKDIANKHRRKFIVNRPFAYFIYQKPSKRVLFSGIFYSP
ncbi:serpin B4-like [Homalodisca vitripennis]|uniref:serpin B4-like n=1 Tax=Homalodisca vitripennis TaxID=197043 RepID=UPI001EE9C50B|nr:serpin B4-like [Homalodisca vitripennis]